MSRPTLSRTLTALALAASLAACGGSDDESVAGPASASPSAEASAAASSPPCPIMATEVPVPDGATKDLKTKPVVKPTTTPPPEVVQYADTVEGDGAEAVAGSQVEVKYVGAFYETGKEFDSSWSRGPDETLPFGACVAGGVIPGFAIGPIGMKVGGRRQIIIPSAFGYGAQGKPPIPGGATLVFVIDLVTVS